MHTFKLLDTPFLGIFFEGIFFEAHGRKKGRGLRQGGPRRCRTGRVQDRQELATWSNNVLIKGTSKMRSSHRHGLWKREGGRWILNLREALGQELDLLSSSGNYRGARQGRAGG